MALQLSLTSLQQGSCAQWVLTDSAGTYSATNTDGWTTATSGGSNLRIDNGSVTYAELIITIPAGNSISIDIIANWTELTGLGGTAFDSGTTPSGLAYTITDAMLTGGILDGVYTVTYKVGDGTTYDNSTNKSTITYTYALYCNIECCIEQRLALVPENYTCETCSNTFLDTTMILWTLLQALKMAACIASVTKFNTILATLQQACEDAGCDCGT